MFNIALPVLRLPYCIAKYKKIKPKKRHLTDCEIALCQRVFGDMVDYSKVKIINCVYLAWQPDDMFIAPNGNLYTANKHYRDDYAKCDRHYQQIFIHEMTHIMQYQKGINVFLCGAYLQMLYYLSFKKFNPYFYSLDNDKTFWQYNIEQQGRICEDIFLGKIDNIICAK